MPGALVPGHSRTAKRRRRIHSGTIWLLVLAAQLVLVLGRPTPEETPAVVQQVASPATDMATCANKPVHSATYGRVRLPNLKVEAVFKSARPHADTEITIITQCSVDRLYMLESQCATWGGVTSAAVYWPLEYFNPTNTERLQTAINEVKTFHAKMEAAPAGGCRLDIVLLSEVIKSQDLWAYPYNALRNQALARAKTEVLLLLDVDFVVSLGLHKQLTEAQANAALLDDTCVQRNVIVLPAFETDSGMGLEAGGETATRAQRSNKEELLKMFEARNIIQFAEFYPVGHKSTNYKKWFASTAPYGIKFKTGYEPYILVSRKYMPWYDERFRGYGWDKVMQIYQLDSMNFHFIVHPKAFVVHRPHPPSSGYNHTFTGEAYTKKHKPTDHLWKMERIAKDMMAELRAGTYPDDGVTALAHCRQITEDHAAEKGRWWR
ncbi:hypothetical protein WJX72_002012 [[Myrmecia] bisecta]|uniref:Uncharacterized protein n=1 Tax=[Myrmecia] bisecta TaxID=41462 RepID=A0AAW1QPH8_9CHLO